MAILIQEQVQLRAHTTLKTGGFARYYTELQSTADLPEALAFAEEKNLPPLIVGGGSNLLIGDDGFPGIVIKMATKGITYSEVSGTESVVHVRAEAGELFDDLVATVVARGLWGLENLSAIPGTVGATPVQNVGAYGVEVADVIRAVEAYDLKNKTKKVFTKDECLFAYRDSFFKTPTGANYVITAVTFALEKNATPKISYADLKNFFGEQDPELASIRAAVITIRAGKFPDWRVVGTAGSFFKNPIVNTEQATTLKTLYPALPLYPVDQNNVKIPLGFILDKVCGLKGYHLGAVGLYEAQALVLVQDGTATTAEIINFVRIIVEKVFTTTGIVIEPEVRFVSCAL